MSRFIRCLIKLLSIIAVSGCGDSVHELDNKLVTISVGGKSVLVELALSPQAQTRGLGGRTTYGKADGMLFVFEKPFAPCFTMKDTEQPLKLFLFNELGQVMDQRQLFPRETGVCFEQKASLALELYTKYPHQIHVGDQLKMPLYR